MFRALILDRKDNAIQADIREIGEEDLPQEDVLVDIEYSSVNYKDALAVTGQGKIIRGGFPFVPGIDLVGEVVVSKSPDFAKGDKVIGNGWGLGEAYWGGYAQMAHVKPKMLVRLPDGMSYKHAMTFGTAGFTAMLSVMSLEAQGVTPDQGEIVVTGATGGVGSIGIVLLSRLGYEVVASSGKAHAHAYLKELGARRIIGREELGDGPARPLDNGTWAGAIDNVGGPALAALISQMKRHGSIASCGLASSHALETTVYPFILRGVNLLGIDSATCTHERRKQAWERIAAIPESVFDRVTEVITLDEVLALCKKMMDSKIQGRFVVDVNR